MTSARGERETGEGHRRPEPIATLQAKHATPGDLVQVRVNGVALVSAEVENVTAEGTILWTVASPQLPRALFLRQTDSDGWTSR
ncbi:hypothetical protein [Sinomonas humi]|uniref:Uncharacterized protein n=1 Tax=Sinomonas humi TaxID=1338436 RepID=A0A0B2AQ78_9MICC|nr:hypothetical protein [Sinomonas humi]KHL05552.1 hypothetical protein LK10_00660 [Sinomonas humi]